MAKNDDWVEVPLAEAGVDDWEDITEPSLGQSVLKGVGMVGHAVDAYGGDASTRAAIYAAQKGQSPVQAFLNQYGDSETAPTGKQIAMEAGVKDEPLPDWLNSIGRAARDYTPTGIAYKNLAPENVKNALENSSQADLAGMGVEMAASPANLLPAGKPIVKGISGISDFVAQAVKNSYLGRKGAEGINAAGRGAARVGEWATGVPAQDIRVYASEAPEIRKMMEQSGGSIPEAADQMREKFQGSIRDRKSELGQQIDDAIKSSPSKTDIEAKPIIDFLEQRKSELDPLFQKEDIGQLEAIINQVKLGTVPEGMPNKSGLTNTKYLNFIKKYLQERARSSYMKDGQIFHTAGEAQRAAKGGGAVARDILNEAAPEIASANKNLSELHDIDEVMKPGLIAPGKSEAALISAGSGVNERNANVLKELGDFTNTDMIGDARRLSAARMFHNPSLSPVDSTGKALYRQGIGAGIGAGAAHILDIDPKIGAAVGAAATSPAALKAIMDTGRAVGSIPVKVGETIINITPKQFMEAYIANRASRGEQVLEKDDQEKKKKKVSDRIRKNLGK